MYHQTDLFLRVSADDLKMILSAMDAYSHNLDYRDLRDRLHRQAAQRAAVKPS